MSDWVQVYVRGYPKRVGEQDLKKFFSRFGKVQEVRLMYDFAFVVTQSKFRPLPQLKKQSRQSRAHTARQNLRQR